MHARMFAPGWGSAKTRRPVRRRRRSPAAWRRRLRVDVRRLTITQGVEIGRPSTIETETHFAGGNVVGVAVGGGAVVVGEGRFDRLP